MLLIMHETRGARGGLTRHAGNKDKVVHFVPQLSGVADEAYPKYIGVEWMLLYMLLCYTCCYVVHFIMLYMFCYTSCYGTTHTRTHTHIHLELSNIWGEI